MTNANLRLQVEQHVAPRFGNQCGCSVLRVGPEQPFRTIASAVAAARAFDEIEIQAGIYPDDTAVIDKPLALTGTGGMPILQSIGFIANGRGILLTRADVRLRNLSFVGAVVLNGNGAGVWHEAGNLVVERCTFRNCQNGLFIGYTPGSVVTVRYSSFIGNGAGDGHTHGLYVGDEIDCLLAENNTFTGTIVGHHLKSRARRNLICHNTIGDGVSGTASYAVDVPNGGRALLLGNQMIRGPNAGHRVLVRYAAEGLAYPDNSFQVIGNSFINRGGGPSIAVKMDTWRIRAKLVANLREGSVLRLIGRP